VPNTLAKPAINKSMIATMQYEAFRAMLDSVIAARGPKNLTVESLIHRWWGTAFPHRPFPPEGGSVLDLSLAIKYQLMLDGYEREGVAPSEDFLVNHEAATTFTPEDFADRSKRLYACEKLGNLAMLIITPSTQIDGGFTMATKKSNESNSSTEKKTAKKAAKKTEAKERTPGATGYVCELLMERKHADSEILAMVGKKFPDRTEKQIKVYISVQRAEINAGRKPSHQVTKPLERLVIVDGKTVPYVAGVATKKEPKAAAKKATSKAAAKKDSKAPAKKKAAAKKTA